MFAIINLYGVYRRIDPGVTQNPPSEDLTRPPLAAPAATGRYAPFELMGGEE